MRRATEDKQPVHLLDPSQFDLNPPPHFRTLVNTKLAEVGCGGKEENAGGVFLLPSRLTTVRSADSL